MKYLDPKNDVIFKKIFGQHPNILRSFLNSMLPLPEGKEIVELEYLSNEMIPETFLEKFTSVDVRCKDKTGRQFLVEMQMNWTTVFKYRVIFNASKAYVKQTEMGSEFRNLQPVYALNLINENYSPASEKYFHHYADVQLKGANNKLNGLEYVFIELPKFKAKNIREMNMRVMWLRYLTEIGESTKEIPMELTTNNEIRQAINLLQAGSLNATEMYLYDKSWDRISCERTLLAAAKEEGRAAGLLMVKQEIAIEARKMGKSTADISKLTGLSEDEIMNL
jgi:predicted transposase/invertase (TIGR01784 family)